MPLFNDMVQRARGAHDDFDYEFRLRMPDHSVKYLHVIAHATHDRDGRILEYIGAAQDVTQRRLSEEALAKTRSELAHVAQGHGSRRVDSLDRPRSQPAASPRSS